MPKITHFNKSRNIDIDRAPSKLRMKMLRNQILFVVEPTEGEEGRVIDIFDDLDTGVHQHSTGLFYLHTTFQNLDGEYQDATRYLQVWLNFERHDDMESVLKNVLLPLKLSL
jgi:hypothetical protein